jgi:hypothetical protein
MRSHPLDMGEDNEAEVRPKKLLLCRPLGPADTVDPLASLRHVDPGRPLTTDCLEEVEPINGPIDLAAVYQSMKKGLLICAAQSLAEPLLQGCLKAMGHLGSNGGEGCMKQWLTGSQPKTLVPLPPLKKCLPRQKIDIRGGGAGMHPG